MSLVPLSKLSAKNDIQVVAIPAQEVHRARLVKTCEEIKS
jgi:hypothetical protein